MPRSGVKTLYKRISKKLRQNIMKRYHYKCQRCGRKFAKFERNGLTIHHGDKKPYCRKCHNVIEYRK